MNPDGLDDDLYYFDAELRMGCVVDTESETDSATETCSLSFCESECGLDDVCCEFNTDTEVLMRVWVETDWRDGSVPVEVPTEGTVGHLKQALRSAMPDAYDAAVHNLSCGGCIMSDNEQLLCDTTLHESDFRVTILAKAAVVARDRLRSKGVKRNHQSLVRKVREGDIETVSELLVAGVPSSGGGARQPLEYSILRSSHDDITNLLIHHHADVNSKAVQEAVIRKATPTRLTDLITAFHMDISQIEFSTLVWAAVNREPSFLQLLLSSGCDPAPPTQPRSLLSHAASTYNITVETIFVILKTGRCTVDTKDRDTGMVPIMHGVGIPAVPVSILQALRPAEINTVDTRGNSALTLLLNSAYISRHALGYLIRLGADVNVALRNEKTPLILSCEKGRTLISLDLLKAGADVNYTTSKGISPLSIACFYRYLDLAKVLISHGAIPAPTYALFNRSPTKADRLHFLVTAGIPPQDILAIAKERNDSPIIQIFSDLLQRKGVSVGQP